MLKSRRIGTLIWQDDRTPTDLNIYLKVSSTDFEEDILSEVK